MNKYFPRISFRLHLIDFLIVLQISSPDLKNFVANDLLHSARLKLWDSVGPCALPKRSSGDKCLRLQWKKIDNFLNRIGGSENIFSVLFGHHSAEDTFWLDSSSVDQVLIQLALNIV